MKMDHSVKLAALEDVKSSNLSIASIAGKYGRSASTISKWMKDEGIRRTGTATRGLKPFASMDWVSPDHVRLGLHLLKHRGGLEKSAFASALTISATKLGQMENGLHDFKLTELQAIGDLLGEEVIMVLPGFGENRTVH